MKISVALCTYNGNKYIKEQLESICNQTTKVDEIIISDDGSKDNTLEICHNILSLYGMNYKIVQNKESLKVMKNFQQAFSLCTGDVIFSCDQDDIWKLNKVETVVRCFKQYPKINMIATNATLIDRNGDIMNLSLHDSIDMPLNNEEEILNSLLKTFCITGATMAFRRKFQNDFFYLSNYWLHDGWLALIAALNNSLIYLDDELIEYRLHGNNECGVGDVDLLHHGSLEKLRKRKRTRVIKTAITKPFYFEDYANLRFRMYKEIRNQIDQNNWSILDDNITKLDQCINFWRTRTNLRNLKFKECLKKVHDMKRYNEYNRFCESKWFSIFDIYFWIIYKCFPRRNKK